MSQNSLDSLVYDKVDNRVVTTPLLAVKPCPKFIWDEELRVEKLKEYDLMYTAPETSFDRIVDLVKHFFNTDIVAINFIDDKEQFAKACIGLDQLVIPKEISFCLQTIAQTDIICLPDTFQVPELANHPFVTSENPIRFYAGVPIVVYTKDNYAYVLGALCIADSKPYTALTKTQRHILHQFSAMITDTIELRAQQQKSARADEIKSAFLANMSHEIRTPMNGIMGMLEMLKETSLDSEQMQAIEQVQTANQHLLTIVNDIVDLSKIQSGKMTFALSQVNLHELCQQVLEGFATDIQAKSLQVTCEYDSNIARQITTDPLRVRQILTNLINNAIKFTSDGGAITVKTVLHRDVQHLELQVVDTGVGIRPASLAVIFDAYNQADKFTHRVYGGTGLGLSVCKALADAMGGTMTVESEYKKGSTFSLILPYLPVEEVSTQTPMVNTVYNDTKRYNVHVLLAEDNELNAMVAIKSLKKYGYEVTLAKDGKAALELFRGNPSKYGIILMDHQMPIMDGVQATKLLREEFDKLPPIIAVTAHAMHGDKKLYLDVGMQDCLTKPYKPAQLDELIQYWLQRSQ